MDEDDTNGDENTDGQLFLYVRQRFNSDWANEEYCWEPYGVDL